MFVLKEMIDFLFLWRSPAAMSITNLCNTQTLSAAQCAKNTHITYHISLSVSVSLTLSLTHSLTFPLINTLGSVCVLQIQTRGKMKKRKVWLTSAARWQQGYKGVQISSKCEQCRWVRSRDVYRDPSGPFSFHLTSFHPIQEQTQVISLLEPSCCKWSTKLKAKNF